MRAPEDPATGSFDMLTPDAAVAAVEQTHGLRLDGTLFTYPSYVNRVYGVRTEEGEEYISKFYRPNRWSTEAILEEHEFLLDCVEAEIPVVPPIPDADGDTLGILEVTAASDDAGPDSVEYPFALFPKRGGRNFDAETDEQWYRLGSIVGRCHLVGRRREAPHRRVCSPQEWTAPFVTELLDEELVHPDLAGRFQDLTGETLGLIEPHFAGVPFHRIHGDCHRGNLLDRPDEGLMIIDFDDMMSGPAVQDIWLLLPGHAADCGRELTMLLEGYETFLELPRQSLRLIEPLRFMRIVHFLAWRARQRHDHWFRREFPDWGTKQFWIREVEDLEMQADIVQSELSGR
ncbi:MAG: serine/threonine protein kinase [Spirochaetaceae bacterium]